MIHTLDLNFMGTTGAVAAYAIPGEDGLTLVETGPHSTLPALRAALLAHGYSLSDVRHALLTHIHLDHAGAAWALAAAGATIYVHPVGMRHLLAPERLMASARQIYGSEMDRLWGEMRPIPSERLVAVGHGETLMLGGHGFAAWHTPGHAVHHISWQLEGVVFTGDVAGIRIGSQAVVQPPCPPPDIDIPAWESSIELLSSLRPAALYLTHFGEVTAVDEHLRSLRSELSGWTEWMRPYFLDAVPTEQVIPLFERYVESQLEAAGVGAADRIRYRYANPAWMSVSGLLRYWRKATDKGLV
ncbi:MAG: hypothetical protein RLY31_1146 [Bacteroidota bacterium]